MPILVNGETIEDSAVRAEMTAIRPAYEEAMADMDPIAREIQLKDWSRENVIERVLLRQAALKEPVTNPETGEVDPEASLQSMLEKLTSKVSPPRSKDIGDYYVKNKEQFWMPELVHAAHIVKNVDENTTEEQALEAITAVKAELDGGADFRTLADQHSDCAGNGGDLGYFARGEMVEEFDNVIFALQVNETSPIFRTAFGFHVARVIDRKPEGVADLTDVRGQIERVLTDQKKQRAVEQFADQLRAKADIQTK